MSKLTANQIEELRADGPAIITDGSWQALCDMALASLAGQDGAAAGEERAPVEAAGVGEPECVTVLRGYQQVDADGVMVTASRQAIDETLTYLDNLRSALRGACHDAAEQQMGCFRAVRAERLMREAQDALRGSYEECARICEEIATNPVGDSFEQRVSYNHAAFACHDAIRAAAQRERGKHE